MIKGAHQVQCSSIIPYSTGSIPRGNTPSLRSGTISWGDNQLQGWMFINFIALMMHYRIYAMLKSKDMQRKYSPGDVLVHLERVSRLKIGDEWKTSEIPRKSRIIIDSLDIPIM